MKDKQSAARKDEKKATKKTYAKPVLKAFGTVSKLTMGAGTVAGDSGPLSMMTGSDAALKENVVRVGQHPLGIGMYLFDYLPAYRDEWGHGRQLGVLAGEVEAVMPEAVSVHPDGYKVVDYAMLGIMRGAR